MEMKESVLKGLPTLLPDPPVSQIHPNWPFSLELPDPFKESSKTTSKENKKILACPHKDRSHYAKNMCYTCYHREGRIKPAWLCEHTDRPNYARGKCKQCYTNQYNSKLKEKYRN